MRVARRHAINILEKLCGEIIQNLWSECHEEIRKTIIEEAKKDHTVWETAVSKAESCKEEYENIRNRIEAAPPIVRFLFTIHCKEWPYKDEYEIARNFALDKEKVKEIEDRVVVAYTQKVDEVNRKFDMLVMKAQISSTKTDFMEILNEAGVDLEKMTT